MKKKVKKIPKFKDGGLTWKDMSNDQRWNAGIEAVGAIGNTIGTAMSGQDVTLGGAISSAGSLAATGFKIGGPIGAGIGAGVGLIAGTAGRKNSVNENSTSTSVADIAEEGSGWMKWFGMSEEEMMAKANRIANANISEQMTEQIRSKYAMNPNNPNGGTILAAEGGIVPGEHYASRGEVEVAANGTNAVRYGWDNNGKDTYHVYVNPDGSSAVGNMVFTEEGVKRPNGEKYSDAAEKIIKGTKEGSKLRQISLRKLANEMEEQKMNKDIKQIKNGIPAHEKGIYYVDGQRAEYRHGRWWWNEGGNKDAQGKMYFVPYTGKSIPSETEPTKYTSETPVGPLDPAYRQHVRYSSTNDVERKATVSKPSSSKKTTASRVITSTAPQEEKLTPEQIAESLRIADIGERHWLRGSVTEPKQSFASIAKTTPEKIKSQGVNNAFPLTGIKPLTDTTGTDNTGYTGSNWKDNLYRMAVLSQPLWDRAEAEPVNYESPVYKYMPTQIDVSSQLRDTDQSYALSRYNFANLYPNTGAGMAAGLQAASNRAKQYADIRQWQTNAQNELIGKNVGIYNNWANEHARIMNDVYNKTAANRAAARNINRKNIASTLNNWGTMLNDNDKKAIERMKFAALTPAIQSTYEDASANDIYKWYKELFG